MKDPRKTLSIVLIALGIVLALGALDIWMGGFIWRARVEMVGSAELNWQQQERWAARLAIGSVLLFIIGIIELTKFRKKL